MYWNFLYNKYENNKIYTSFQDIQQSLIWNTSTFPFLSRPQMGRKSKTEMQEMQLSHSGAFSGQL